MTRRSRLRLCAFVVLASALLVTGWFALGMVGIPAGRGDFYYQAASSRALIPFPAALAAIALVVAKAAGTSMVRRKRATAGLWLILAGAAILLVSIAAEYWLHSGAVSPMRMEYVDLGYFLALSLATGSAGILLLVGLILWLSARLPGKRRAA